MAVKKFKPMTPGTRHKVIGTFDDITSSTPEKSLLTPLKSTGGRNNSGKMTVRYIGGGHKKMYRIVDFKRNKDNMSGTVKTIEYDPNRSARIALITYADGEKRYILAPNGLQVGQVVSTGAGAAPEVGNTLFLSDIPLGTVIPQHRTLPRSGRRDGPQCRYLRAASGPRRQICYYQASLGRNPHGARYLPRYDRRRVESRPQPRVAR